MLFFDVLTNSRPWPDTVNMAYVTHEKLNEDGKKLYFSEQLLPVAIQIGQFEPGFYFYRFQLERFLDFSQTAIHRTLGRLSGIGLVEKPSRLPEHPHDQPYTRLDDPRWRMFTSLPEIYEFELSEIFDPTWENMPKEDFALRVPGRLKSKDLGVQREANAPYQNG